MRPFSLSVPVVVKIYHGPGGDSRRTLWRGPQEEEGRISPRIAERAGVVM